MAFSFTWNATFDAQPADNEALSLGAGRIRDLKSAIGERAEVDHNWNGGTDDGEHKKVTLGAPIATPTNAADKGFVYGKDVGAKIELHWLDEDGNEVQITSVGKLAAAALGLNALTEESGITTGDFLAFYDTTAAAMRKVDYEDFVVLPRGHIDGMILSNNGTDADHDIDVSAGQCRDGSDSANITLAAITKQIDAAWAVGTNQGGLDTGTVAIDTWYHVWAIRRSDTGVTDVLFSTSVSAPTMPTDYDQKRRIGAVLTDGSANIIAFFQHDDYFWWATEIGDIDYSSSGVGADTEQTETISTPLGLRVIALLNTWVSINGAGSSLRIYSPQNADVTADSAPTVYTRTLYGGSGRAEVLTDTSSQIKTRSDNSSLRYEINTLGWIDPRGRDA